MKNLTIIRHGKSGYELGLTDKQRKLNQTGIDNSIWVAQQYLNYLPNNYNIVSSSAIRAKMTAEVFAKAIGISEGKIQLFDDLYTFDVREFEQIIKLTDNEIVNLLVFGHNDAITDFVNKFGRISIDNVPTSGLISINFDIDNWANIKNGITIKTIFPSKE